MSTPFAAVRSPTSIAGPEWVGGAASHTGRGGACRVGTAQGRAWASTRMALAALGGMPTRSQATHARDQFERRPSRPARPKRRRRDDPVDTSRPGVSASDRKASGDLQGLRNVRSIAGRRGGAQLEESSGTPSRKSTRGSADRTKRTTNQQLRAIMRTASPPRQHARGAAKAKSTRGRGARTTR